MNVFELFQNTNFVAKDVEPQRNPPIKTPSELKRQVFLMDFPMNFSTRDPNNVWMKKAKNQDELKINYEHAFRQFFDLYHFVVSQGALVYLLPAQGHFQDQEYVANLGIYLPHKKNTIILSNFTSPPRKGEEFVGEKFFKQMKYDVHMCPEKWEGEAELKYLRDNIYLGGWGFRSKTSAYDWMEKKFDMKIIPVEIKDPKMYHFDTMFLRLTEDKVLMPTDRMNKKDIKNVEKYAEIVHVPTDVILTGCFNAVMCGNYLMYADENHLLGDYPELSVRKVAKYMKIVCDEMKLTPKAFNLEEFERSGADLGCLFMHLNYRGF